MSFANFKILASLALAINLHAGQLAPALEGLFEQTSAEKALQNEDDAFDVVSIRPSKQGGQLSFDLTANGFTARSTPMFWVILEAYYPGPMSYWRKDRLTGVPSWVGSEEFDIDAKVSDLESKRFEHLTEPEREARVKRMLRTALRDRLRLQVSEESSPSFVWALTSGKHEPKIKQSVLSAAAPAGIPISGGGVMRPLTVEDNRHAMQFYRTSMPAFVEALTGLGTESDLPIVDCTGLEGRYDFILQKREIPSELSEGTAPAPATQWDIEGLGFRFKRVTQALPSLVVSHIDEPTPN